MGSALACVAETSAQGLVGRPESLKHPSPSRKPAAHSRSRVEGVIFAFCVEAFSLPISFAELRLRYSGIRQQCPGRNRLPRTVTSPQPHEQRFLGLASRIGSRDTEVPVGHG